MSSKTDVAKSRDPLAVLREHAGKALNERLTLREYDETKDAIAQVEALVEAAKQARRIIVWHTEYKGGPNRTDAGSIAELDALIATFTPGTN